MTKQFLLGLAFGAGVGMLIAPHPGRVTRSKLWARGKREQDGAQPFSPTAESVGTPEVSNAAPASATRPFELGEDQRLAEVLNHARKAELTSVKGIGDVTAKRIIKNRPYTTAEEAVREEVIPEETLARVREQLVEGKTDDESAA